MASRRAIILSSDAAFAAAGAPPVRRDPPGFSFIHGHRARDGLGEASCRSTHVASPCQHTSRSTTPARTPRAWAVRGPPPPDRSTAVG
eukprot:4171625-Prymnesium_polylepis.2